MEFFFFVILWVKTKETVCFIHTPASCWVWRVQVSYQLLALAFKLAFQIQLLDKARLNVGKLNLRLLLAAFLRFGEESGKPEALTVQ